MGDGRATGTGACIAGDFTGAQAQALPGRRKENQKRALTFFDRICGMMRTIQDNLSIAVSVTIRVKLIFSVT